MTDDEVRASQVSETRTRRGFARLRGVAPPGGLGPFLPSPDAGKELRWIALVE